MPQKVISARETAFAALTKCDKNCAWSDSVLKAAIRADGLSHRDSALCSRLCYGVQQNRMLLDFWIGHFSSVKLEKLEPALRLALELGIYQIALMDRIPESAAVNESVNLAKRHCKNPNSSRVANGILRSVCRKKTELPEPDSLAVQYSHPQWLVELLQQEVPEGGIEALLQANNSQPPTTVQVNTLRTTTKQLTEELTAAGVTVKAHPWLPDCLELSGTGDLEELEAFQRGAFLVQDAAARLAVLAAAPKQGDKVLDACAAPGGKSFSAAIAVENDAKITSCDIHAGKVKLIGKGAKRLGIRCITSEVRSAKEFDPALEQAFDVVITDVPCSGLGIIRKKPDIRTKDPSALEGLPKVQRGILWNASRYVKAGGVLLYATCTVLRRENQQVVETFLAEHSDYTAEAFSLPGIGAVEQGMLTLWPHIHGTDGFFMAKLRRKE